MVRALDWPEHQRFLTASELGRLLEVCRPAFDSACAEMRIHTDLSPLLASMYLPLAAWLIRRRAMQSAPLVVGLTGGQGSGKSTVSDLLRAVLTSGFDASAAILSIDDIYKTHAERQRMAARVHPLFATRGVPGTHDVELGIRVVERLCSQSDGDELRLPSFDKAMDDRRAQSEWPTFTGRPDIVMFEGWCVGARPESSAALADPVNALERDEDPEGIWRGTVNEELKGEYARLFGLIDVQLMLAVDGMERVFEWRRLQEHKLRERVAESGANATRVMSDAEVDRFIMHYERITRHLLAEMPQRADIVFALDASHAPATVQVNRPL